MQVPQPILNWWFGRGPDFVPTQPAIRLVDNRFNAQDVQLLDLKNAEYARNLGRAVLAEHI